MTKLSFYVLCYAWWKTILWNKSKQLPAAYFQKYPLYHVSFCRIINAFPLVLKETDIILFRILTNRFNKFNQF